MVNVHRGSGGQGTRVGDGHRLPRHGRRGAGRDRSGRDTSGAPSSPARGIIRDKNVLDVRSADIAAGIGRLDVVIKKVVPEVRKTGVVDAGKIVIRHHRGNRLAEILDLGVVGGRRQGGRGGRQDPLGHGNGNPGPHLVGVPPEGSRVVDLVDLAGEGVGPIVVLADLQNDVGDPGNVVGKSPDIEFGVHLFQEARVSPGNGIEPAERVAAGIVRKPLGLEDRGRSLVVGRPARADIGVQQFMGPPRGEGGFDLIVVAQASIVVEPRVQAGEVNMPGPLRQVGIAVGSAVQIVVRILDLPCLHRAPFRDRHLLGCLAPVGPGDHRRPAVEFGGKSGSLDVDLGVVDPVGGVGIGDGGLHPFEKIRGSIVSFRKNPGAVLDMNHPRGRPVLVDEVLDGHAGIGPVVHQPGGVPIPGGGSPAPGVVTVRGRQNDAGTSRIVGVRGDISIDQTFLPSGIARFVALNVIRRHQHDGFFHAGFGIHILGLVQLVGVGGVVPGGFPDITRAKPPRPPGGTA